MNDFEKVMYDFEKETFDAWEEIQKRKADWEGFKNGRNVSYKNAPISCRHENMPMTDKISDLLADMAEKQVDYEAIRLGIQLSKMIIDFEKKENNNAE